MLYSEGIIEQFARNSFGTSKVRYRDAQEISKHTKGANTLSRRGLAIILCLDFRDTFLVEPTLQCSMFNVPQESVDLYDSVHRPKH